VKAPLQPPHSTELLGALAAPERLRIIRLLGEGPHNVGEIAEMLGAPIVNVSHHLAVLRHARLVRTQKQGRFVIYSLPPGAFQPGSAPGSPECLDLGCCRLEIPKPDV